MLALFLTLRRDRIAVKVAKWAAKAGSSAIEAKRFLQMAQITAD
jgi:hypothetical protein